MCLQRDWHLTNSLTRNSKVALSKLGHKHLDTKEQELKWKRCGVAINPQTHAQWPKGFLNFVFIPYTARGGWWFFFNCNFTNSFFRIIISRCFYVFRKRKSRKKFWKLWKLKNLVGWWEIWILKCRFFSQNQNLRTRKRGFLYGK